MNGLQSNLSIHLSAHQSPVCPSVPCLPISPLFAHQSPVCPSVPCLPISPLSAHQSPVCPSVPCLPICPLSAHLLTQHTAQFVCQSLCAYFHNCVRYAVHTCNCLIVVCIHVCSKDSVASSQTLPAVYHKSLVSGTSPAWNLVECVCVCACVHVCVCMVRVCVHALPSSDI